MSISYCDWCEEIVEGNTVKGTPEGTGEEIVACGNCGEEVTELSEDSP